MLNATYTAIHGYTGETQTFYSHSEALIFAGSGGTVTMFEDGILVARW